MSRPSAPDRWNSDLQALSRARRQPPVGTSAISCRHSRPFPFMIVSLMDDAGTAAKNGGSETLSVAARVHEENGTFDREALLLCD